jgi:hypothetical protein
MSLITYANHSTHGVPEDEHAYSVKNELKDINILVSRCPLEFMNTNVHFEAYICPISRHGHS